ncbi:MAG: hypothetical protein LBE13_11525 [Bacteroidales bacterium]|jgi:hypothetical protein|nr:hypothetical protein [Bacteroidales bacterium]
MKSLPVLLFREKNIALSDKHFYLLLLLASVVVLLASPLAPFANKIPGIDSNVFIYCAQRILEGKIIYKEVFDHKGPLLYIFNILGILLGKGNPSGIWFVELISLFVSSLYIYKSISLFWRRDIAFFSTLSCLLFFTSVFDHGNYAEEYSILFISISQYYFVSFLKDRKIHYPHFSIIAVCFACVLLIKANGAVSWLVGWMMVAFLLLKAKRIVDLLKVISISLSIVFLILLLFIGYLFFTDSFSDFKYCYWDFNQAYSDVSYKIISRTVKRSFFFSDMRCYNIYIFLSLSALFFIFFNKTYKYKFPILFYIFSFVFTSVAISVSETSFIHYYLVYIPILSCFHAIVYDAITKQLKSHSFLFLFLLVLIFHTESITYFYSDVRKCFQKQEGITEIVSFIKNNTGEDDKIYVIGNACIFYNLSHRESASKYPYLFPIASIKKYSDSMINQFYRDMEINQPKIIYKNWYKANWIEYEDIPGIDAFLEKNYTKVQNMIGFDCYIKKQK